MGVPAIQNWKPLHDQVVQLHIAGVQNQVIAEIFGLTQERISQILHDPIGRQLIRLGQQRLRETIGRSIEDRLLILADRSIDNLRLTVEQDGVDVTSSFKRHQDSVGFKILEMAGYGKKDEHDRKGDATPTKEQMGKMLDLLDRREQARELVDAEFTIEPAGRTEDA